MSDPLHVAFLGCGFITRVHSQHLKGRCRTIVPSYASRDRGKAEEFRRQFGGRTAFGSYDEALADRGVDAVVIAVPPRFHLDLTQRALAGGKHVLVEKPAFLRAEDYTSIIAQRDQAGRLSSSARTITTSHCASACGACWPKTRSATWCSGIS